MPVTRSKTEAQMEKENYYRNLFFIGAIWNWMVAIVSTFFYHPMFRLLGMDDPVYPGILYTFFGVVFVFGIGYYWISRDLENNDNIVKMGILGKTWVFAVALYYAIVGDFHWLLVLPGTVDLVFAGLFIEFLFWKTRRASVPG